MVVGDMRPSPSTSRRLLAPLALLIPPRLLMAAHARDVAAQLLNSLDYIEGMLRSQLTTAIGKELTADDFDE